jgi:hypothetical protein
MVSFAVILLLTTIDCSTIALMELLLCMLALRKCLTDSSGYISNPIVMLS